MSALHRILGFKIRTTNVTMLFIEYYDSVNSIKLSSKTWKRKTHRLHVVRVDFAHFFPLQIRQLKANSTPIRDVDPVKFFSLPEIVAKPIYRLANMTRS